MTTEKQQDQTRQDLKSQNQDPNRKVPADRPADDPRGGPAGEQKGMGSTAT